MISKKVLGKIHRECLIFCRFLRDESKPSWLELNLYVGSKIGKILFSLNAYDKRKFLRCIFCYSAEFLTY